MTVPRRVDNERPMPDAPGVEHRYVVVRESSTATWWSAEGARARSASTWRRPAPARRSCWFTGISSTGTCGGGYCH